MVALLVKIGGLLFKGELGVRLVGCLLWNGSLMLIWSLIDHKEKEKFVSLYFLLAFSMVLFNAYGFLSLPDTPVLFFTALFLWLYKRFLKQESVGIALAMGLCMAALLYSKYNAVLIILFMLLSNLKLIVNKYAWLSVLVALVAYSPHLIWLYNHDFVAVKFHLFERPNHAYKFSEFTLGYVANLLINFGLLFPWFYWALFKTRSTDKFTRSLLFIIYGIILFFLLSSFQRRIQAQWVVAMCVPMLVISFDFILNHVAQKKWIWRVGIISTILIIYVRVWLVYRPLIPFLKYETHDAKKWVRNLHDNVEDTPVVFENSYRKASMYSFYSGIPAFSLNNINYRQSQYSIDNSESEFQNKRIAYIADWAKSGDFSYLIGDNKSNYGQYVDHFKSFRKLRCDTGDTPVDLRNKNQVLKLYNPYQESIVVDSLKVYVAYFNIHKKMIETHFVAQIYAERNPNILAPESTTLFFIDYPDYKIEKPKYLKFSISDNQFSSGINSTYIKVKP